MRKAFPPKVRYTINVQTIYLVPRSKEPVGCSLSNTGTRTTINSSLLCVSNTYLYHACKHSQFRAPCIHLAVWDSRVVYKTCCYEVKSENSTPPEKETTRNTPEIRSRRCIVHTGIYIYYMSCTVPQEQ